MFWERDSALNDDQVETMAKEAVEGINWNNPFLMHKDLRWIANNYYDRWYAVR